MEGGRQRGREGGGREEQKEGWSEESREEEREGGNRRKGKWEREGIRDNSTVRHTPQVNLLPNK